MKKITIYLLLLLSLPGCEKKTNRTYGGAAGNLVIVDAIITDELKNQTVTLTFPVAALNEIPKPVSGASILISDEDSTFDFTEQPAGSGIYRSNNKFLARLGLHYTLLIFYHDQVLSAKADMAPGIIPSPLNYSKDEESALFHLDWVASSFSTQPPVMWEILLDWSAVPGYELQDSTKTHARLLFYTLSTLDVSEIFAARVESISFPAGTLITERSYSLTPDYAGFIRQVLLETQWQGGLFNSLRANVTTNLSTGAAGFFAVSAVNTLSLTVGK